MGAGVVEHLEPIRVLRHDEADLALMDLVVHVEELSALPKSQRLVLLFRVNDLRQSEAGDGGFDFEFLSLVDDFHGMSS